MCWGMGMSDNAFAVTASSFRAINNDASLHPGETAVSEVPKTVLAWIEADQRRQERAKLLRGTDWTQLPDSPLTSGEREAWADYRQALRDLPAQPGFPDCDWPIAPSA